MRYFLPLFLCLFGITLAAQYEKGSWWLDGNSFMDINNESASFELLNARIKGGKFLRDNLLVGTALDFGLDEGAMSSVIVSPFVRYYLPFNQVSKFKFYGEAGLSVNLSDGLGSTGALALGSEYQLLPGVVLNAELRHDFTAGQFSGGSTASLGLNLLFGEATTNQGAEDFTRRKGDFLLDGNFGNFSFINPDIRYGNLNLSGGYFLNDQLLFTAGAAFNSTFFRFFDDDVRKNTGITASAGLRYQFRNGKQLQPYVAAGLRYDYERQVNSEDGFTTRTATNNALSADLRVGALYYLNSRIAVDFGLQYRPTISGSEAFHGTRVVGKIGLNIFIGN